MTNPLQVVAYGESGQKLYCPHLDEAVPSGDVTVSILDEGGSELETGTATKGTLDTTLSAAAAAGARSISVTSETGAAIGDPIVLTDAQGRTELHEVEGVDTGVISLKSRLAHAFASGDDVDSALIYYSLDASTEADWPTDIYYQCIFENTNWDRARAVLFRIADLAATNPIRFEDIRKWAPYAPQLRDGYDSSGLEEARDSAWDLIRTRIESAGRDPEAWRGSERARSVGGLLAAGLFLLSHAQFEQGEYLIGNPPGEGGIFASHWAATAKLLGWFDEDMDRAIDRGERQIIGSTYVRRSL